MKVFYLNDELKNIIVRVNHQIGLNGIPRTEDIILVPREGRIIEIDAPKGSIPYVKRWENRVVLLTYLPLEAQDQGLSTSDR